MILLIKRLHCALAASFLACSTGVAYAADAKTLPSQIDILAAYCQGVFEVRLREIDKQQESLKAKLDGIPSSEISALDAGLEIARNDLSINLRRMNLYLKPRLRRSSR